MDWSDQPFLLSGEEYDGNFHSLNYCEADDDDQIQSTREDRLHIFMHAWRSSIGTEYLLAIAMSTSNPAMSLNIAGTQELHKPNSNRLHPK